MDYRTKPSVYLTCKVGNGSNDENRTNLPEVKETVGTHHPVGKGFVKPTAAVLVQDLTNSNRSHVLQNKIYAFDHDKAVLSLEATECATCTLMDYDRNEKARSTVCPVVVSDLQ